MNTFCHNGAMGDIVYSLPTIIALGGGVLYIKKELHYVFLNRLLKEQAYLCDVILKYKGLNPVFDLNGFRNLSDADTNKHLAVCHLELFNCEFDLSDPWLFVDGEQSVAPIVINRSLNYHDKREIDWWGLAEYRSDVVYIGDDFGYAKFKKHIFEINRYEVKDALEFAKVIKGSKLFIGNQSLGFALAEAMKVPRILEVCYGLNNCQPYGSDGHTYMSKELIERYVYDK